MVDDVGVIVLTESAQELYADVLRNRPVAPILIDLPDMEDRAAFSHPCPVKSRRVRKVFSGA